MSSNSNIIYSEIQKLNVKKWIIQPMVIALVTVAILIVVPFLYFYVTQGNTEIKDDSGNVIPIPIFLCIILGGALFPCAIIYISRRRMNLEISLGKEGFQFVYKGFGTKSEFISWGEVTSIEAKKFPYTVTRPGEQYRFVKTGGHGFIMNLDKMGIQLNLKNGKTIFFSSNSTDDLVKAIKKLDLPIQIIQ